MIVTHLSKTPEVHTSAWVAPDATVCGDVVIGAKSRILFGARVVAEGGRVEIGENCIVMENAVVRSTARHSARIGDHCLIGPNAHVVGCTIENEVFIATGGTVLHGAMLGKGCEVRVNGVVHLQSRVAEKETVPIGWIAVGDPAHILAPEDHDQIWAIQGVLNFPLQVYGVMRSGRSMVEITTYLSEHLNSHREDEVVG